MRGFFCLTTISLIFICFCRAQNATRVFVFTDINIDSGDPDDRQSLVHLLWYANELKIEGIVPDRWNASGLEACNQVIDAYKKDFYKFSFGPKKYPNPNQIREKVAKNIVEASKRFEAAASDNSSPLYVLIWGNMELFGEFLLNHPDYSDNIRLITIGTGLMLEEDISHMPKDWKKSRPCEQLNWNGFGRNSIYNAAQFNDLWWLEINWTYSGMFLGEEPKEMFYKLSSYGSLGKHIKEVVKNEEWAQYFRVGDTPSVLYVIDPNHNLDNPTQSSWAGKFKKPFAVLKPNYYTDDNGIYEWDYMNPCNTWQQHEQVRAEATKTLLKKRPEMYNSLIKKLISLYKK